MSEHPNEKLIPKPFEPVPPPYTTVPRPNPYPPKK